MHAVPAFEKYQVACLSITSKHDEVVLKTPDGSLVQAYFMGEACHMKKEFAFQIEPDEDTLDAIGHAAERATQGEILDHWIVIIPNWIQCRFEANNECQHSPQHPPAFLGRFRLMPPAA